MFIQRSLQFLRSDDRAIRARFLEVRLRLAPHLDPGHALGTIPKGRLPLSDWPRHVRRLFWPVLILTLLLHVLLLVTLLMFVNPFDVPLSDAVPVSLVMLPPDQMPPPPPKPKPPEPRQQPPQPQPKEQKGKPPPPGPLASDDLGDPDATGRLPTSTHAPAAGRTQKDPGEAPPPPAPGKDTPEPSKTTDGKAADKPAPTPSIDQDEQAETPEKLAAGGEAAPSAPQDHSNEMSRSAAKPVPKPAPVRLLRPQPGGAQRPTTDPDALDHGEGRKAKYPGPDANRDEYLAYLMSMTNPYIASVPAQVFDGVRGTILFAVEVRPSGAIVFFSILRSSGSARVDAAFKSVLETIPNYPPLPAHLREPDGSPLSLTLSIQVPPPPAPR